MSRPFTMLVTLFIREESRDEFLEALHEILPLARQDPACLFLYVNEAVEEPGRIILFEHWRDQDEYVNDIVQRDYYKRYLAASESMYAAPRVVVQLNPIDPPSLP
jgi:quinol monooxygenase YgiN